MFPQICWMKLFTRKIFMEHIFNLTLRRSSIFKIKNYKLESIFSYVMVALKLFCTLSVILASGERAFSTLSRIQNLLRAYSTPERTSDLEIPNTKAPLAQ